MTYSPSESEKQSTATVQVLAGFALFVPPLIMWFTRSAQRSPYVRYWTKTCLIWSSFSTIVIASSVVLSVIVQTPSPAVVFYIINMVFCITGALSSYFNTPFRYWCIAKRFCDDELGDVYGQLVSRPRHPEPDA